MKVVMTNSKTAVSDITNNFLKTGPKLSQFTIRKRLESRSIVAIPNHSSAVRLRRVDWNWQGNTEISNKSSKAKINLHQVVERTKCGERMGLLIIHKIQAQWSSIVEVVS